MWTRLIDPKQILNHSSRQHQQLLEKLKTCRHSGARLTKKRAHNADIYGARLSRGSRLVCVVHKSAAADNCLLVLAIFENDEHNAYEHYLQGQAARDYIKWKKTTHSINPNDYRNCFDGITEAAEAADDQELFLDERSVIGFSSVSLSQDQQTIINLKLDKATLVVGPAGAGKTAIANRIACQVLNRGLPVVYLAPTEALIKDFELNVQAALQFSGHVAAEASIIVMTYATYTAQIAHNLNLRVVDFSAFEQWCHTGTQAQKLIKTLIKQLREQTKTKYTASDLIPIIYKEIGILSLQTGIEHYQQLGERSAHFYSKNRGIIAELASYWRKKLLLEGQYDPQCMTSDREALAVANDAFIIFDEVHTAPLACVRDHCQHLHENVLMFTDPNQDLVAGGMISMSSILSNAFGRQNIFQRYLLQQIHRCSAAVTAAANVILEKKAIDCSGTFSKDQAVHLTTTNPEAGRCVFHPRMSTDCRQTLIKTSESANTAFIVFSDEERVQLETIIGIENSTFVFKPQEIPGLDFKVVIVFGAQIPLEASGVKSWYQYVSDQKSGGLPKMNRVAAKDRSQLFSVAAQSAASNVFFLVISRARQDIIFVNTAVPEEKTQNKQHLAFKYFQQAVEFNLNPPSTEAHPADSAAVADNKFSAATPDPPSEKADQWYQKTIQLIRQGNLDLARQTFKRYIAACNGELPTEKHNQFDHLLCEIAPPAEKRTAATLAAPETTNIPKKKPDKPKPKLDLKRDENESVKRKLFSSDDDKKSRTTIEGEKNDKSTELIDAITEATVTPDGADSAYKIDAILYQLANMQKSKNKSKVFGKLIQELNNRSGKCINKRIAILLKHPKVSDDKTVCYSARIKILHILCEIWHELENETQESFVLFLSKPELDKSIEDLFFLFKEYIDLDEENQNFERLASILLRIIMHDERITLLSQIKPNPILFDYMIKLLVSKDVRPSTREDAQDVLETILNYGDNTLSTHLSIKQLMKLFHICCQYLAIDCSNEKKIWALTTLSFIANSETKQVKLTPKTATLIELHQKCTHLAQSVQTSHDNSITEALHHILAYIYTKLKSCGYHLAVDVIVIDSLKDSILSPDIASTWQTSLAGLLALIKLSQESSYTILSHKYEHLTLRMLKDLFSPDESEVCLQYIANIFSTLLDYAEQLNITTLSKKDACHLTLLLRAISEFNKVKKKKGSNLLSKCICSLREKIPKIAEIPELKKLLDEAKIILKQCSPLPQQEIDANELAAVDTSKSPTPFAKKKKKKKKKKQASRSRHVTTAADDHLSYQEADKQFAATEMTVAVTTMKASLFNNPDDTDDPSQAALLHSRPNVI